MLKKKTNLHFIILGIAAIILLSSTQIYAGNGWGWGRQGSSYSGITNMTSINLYNSDYNNILVNNQNVVDNNIYGNIYGNYGVGSGWGPGWGWGRQGSSYSGITNMTSINLYNSDYNNVLVNNESIINNNIYNNYQPTLWYSGYNTTPDFLYGDMPFHSNFSDNNFYTYVPTYNTNFFSPNLDGLSWNY